MRITFETGTSINEQASEYLIILGHSLKMTDLAMIIFTAALVAVGFLQWLWMRKSINDNNATNRAFVFVKNYNYVSHYDPEAKKILWRIAPIWENSGNTPTRDLQLNVNSLLKGEVLPKDFYFPDLNENKVTSYIAPKATVHGGCIDIWGEDLLAAQNNKKFIYMWGSAKYKDVFKNTDEHTTKFCVSFTHISGDPTQAFNQDTNPVGMVFFAQAHNNFFDKNYEKKIKHKRLFTKIKAYIYRFKVHNKRGKI